MKIMDSTFLSDVSVVFPCYNEEHYIKDMIKFIQNLGITNIVIINDGSSDATQKKAIDENVTVIETFYNYGPGTSFLTGLYAVKTKYAFMLEYSISVDKIYKESFYDFIKFGIDGNYSLLLPEKKNKSKFDFLEPKIASILKRRYNVILPEPRLDCAFVGPSLLEKVKTGTLGNKFVMLELIRVASSDNLKIGTYDLKSDLAFDEIRYGKKSLFKSNYQLRNYLKIAFPKLRLQNIKDQVIVAVIIYILFRVIEYTFSTLPFIFT